MSQYVWLGIFIIGFLTAIILKKYWLISIPISSLTVLFLADAGIAIWIQALIFTTLSVCFIPFIMFIVKSKPINRNDVLGIAVEDFSQGRGLIMIGSEFKYAQCIDEIIKKGNIVKISNNEKLFCKMVK